MSTTSQLKVVAPLSGIIVDLDDVPDPVFAQRLVGDGASIDPTSGDVVAPVSGKVTQLHESRHAFTVCTDEGFEVLTHVGVDTVTLRGAGFQALVATGAHVKAGQPVLKFDLAKVGEKARSLLTQVLFANQERISYMKIAHGSVVAGKDILLEITLRGHASVTPPPSVATFKPVVSAPITLRNALGLHARPSAVLAARAKEFASDVHLLRASDEANAKSMTSILSMGTKFGDIVKVRAQGPDAADAVKILTHLLVEGCGEAPADEAGDVSTPETSQPAAKAVQPGEIAGEQASPGIAIGTLVLLEEDNIEVPSKGGNADDEERRLLAALKEAALQLDEAAANEYERAKILSAQKEMLDDPELISQSKLGITAGHSAAFAWRAAYLEQAKTLESLKNAVLKERAVDVRDLGKRVLRLLVGAEARRHALPDKAIVIAEELTPSDVAGMDRKKVAGLCTVHGGATGHVAILAKAMGIPALCGMDETILDLKEGTTVIIDADNGILNHQPDEPALAQARERLNRVARKREADIATAAIPAVTTDGRCIEVAANVQNAEDIREALTLGAEGVGLLRSEFLFEGRASAPSEEEQFAAYRAAAKALGKGKTLVIRTFDVGGDKPLAYLPLPDEANPFLGMRGIRVSLTHPELFRTQLRGILRAAPDTNMHVMFPMVATLSELRTAKTILLEEAKSVGTEVKIGIMIEVPSAALMAGQLAKEVDFFSIGTNDLTQYTLAMDRGHARLAKAADTLEPAVLRMIQMTVDAAHVEGKWVGVCGGAASDPKAVPVLLGLGVDELSVSPPAIPAIKAQIRTLSYSTCSSLAQDALSMESAEAVRQAVANLSNK